MASSADPGQRRKFTTNLTQAVGLVWKAHPGYTVLVTTMTVAQGFLPILQLWLSKLLIDNLAAVTLTNAVPAGSLLNLFILLAAQAGLFLFNTVLGSVQETARTLLGELVSNSVNLQILAKTNSLEIAFFENELFYNKLQNAFQEASHRPLEIVSQLFFLIQTSVTLVSVVFLLVNLHWAILPLLLLTTLPLFWIQTRYGYRNYWLLRERAPERRKQQYLGMLLTSDWFIKEVRVFHLEDYLLKLYRALFAKFFGENRRLIAKRNLAAIFTSAGSICGWLVAMGYVAWRAVERAITIGDFAMYTQAISTAQSGFQSLLSGLSGLYSNALFLNNLFEFLALSARDLTAGQPWDEFIEEIEFRAVSFCYPGTKRSVLNKVSFKIQRGQSLALVGKNGAGKTTLVKLLCRLYEPTSGEILFNGKSISAYSPQSIQEKIAVLFQDYGHYYLSAQENIGVGRVSQLANFPAIKAAAVRSGADSVVEKLPKGYDSLLGKWFEEGTELSGGEWQKVALARAFFRQGGLLILDEPTAALDAEAEFEVFKELTKNNQQQITLLISHRFSTVRMADHILMLEDGKCVEAGSHESLLAANQQYAHLFKLQAKGYEL